MQNMWSEDEEDIIEEEEVEVSEEEEQLEEKDDMEKGVKEGGAKDLTEETVIMPTLERETSTPRRVGEGSMHALSFIRCTDAIEKVLNAITGKLETIDIRLNDMDEKW